MGPLWLLSSMTTKLGTWDGEYKVSRAENIDYLALKTQTVIPLARKGHTAPMPGRRSARHVDQVLRGCGKLQAPGSGSQASAAPPPGHQARGAPRGPRRKLRTLTAALRSARGAQIHLGTPPTPGLSTGCLPRVSRVPCSGSHPVSSNPLHPFPTA